MRSRLYRRGPRENPVSNAYRQTRFTCGNDCVQTGCPGHDMELAHHHTSDTVSVSVDGQHYATFDQVMWDKLVFMEREFENHDHPMFVVPTRYRR